MNFEKVETEEDIKEVAKLACEIWNEYFLSIISKEQIDYMLDNIQSEKPISQQIKDGYEYYLLKDNEENLGYCAIQKREDSLFLSKLYVLKEKRGKGFGHQAFDFVEQKAKEMRLSKIVLTCNKYNLQSLMTYSKWGFETVDSVIADIGGGYVMDDYILEKTI